MEKPNSIATRRVAVQYVIGAVDGPDADDEPDFIPARGVVEFTASVLYTPYPVVSGPNPLTVLNAKITGILDEEGYLCTPDPANPTLPGKRGVRLVCTDNVDGSVAQWTWTATPKFIDANGTRIPDVIPPFSFYLPVPESPDAPDLDLTTVVKVPASQGIGNAQAEALASLASAAAVSSADSAETAVAAALDVKRRADAGEFIGKPGPAGPNTVPTQEAVATFATTTGNPVNAAVNAIAAKQAAVATSGMVSGIGIGRILVSENPNEPLRDGDLLIVVAPRRLFTNFSTYATGQQPADWSNRWASGTPWTIEPASGSTGGKVLRHTATSTARRLFAWDAAATLSTSSADAELVFKSRSTTLDSAARSVLRGAGIGGKETGYYQSYSSSSTPRLGHYLEGAAPTAENADGQTVPFVANEWYITRFRIQGDKRMVRIWNANQPEPAAWSVSTAATQIPAAGLAGLSNFGAGTTEYDWVGMAFGGGTAPMEAV